MTIRNKTVRKIAPLALIGLCASASWAAIGEGSYSPHKYQQNDWFGEFGQTNAMYVNPAGIAENDQLEISMGIFRTISGQAGQEFVAGTMPYDYKHTFSTAIFNNGATIKADNANVQYVEESFMFGYAYRPIHHVAVGADLALLYINLFDKQKEVTPGVDLGVTWNPMADSKLGFLNLGMAIQNAWQPQISKESTGKTSFPVVKSDKTYAIPRNVNLSAFYRGLNRLLEAKAELSLIDVTPEEGEMKMEASFGATYYLSPLLGLKLRLTKEGYPVLGATVNVKDVNFFRYLQLDLDMSHDDLLVAKNRGFIWATKLSTKLGPTREESIGEERYKRLKLEPEMDYRKAMQAYMSRDFLRAAYAFGRVMTKYPSFHLVDQAAFYKGKAFENMRMHEAARKVYTEGQTNYKNSDQQAKYLFQLMNVDYKEGKFADALAKYDQIVKQYGESDVKFDADYVAGQIRFEQRDWDGAIKLLEPIDKGNANYMYSRYTIAMAYSRKGDMAKAELNFQDIINGQASNKAEEDLQNSARIKIGHIYMDKGSKEDVENAFNMYAKVTKESEHKLEAVLGMGWAAVKRGNADVAIKIADGAIGSDQYKNSYLISEFYLVKGYSYYIKKDWAKSLEALEECKKRTSKPIVSQEKREQEKKKFDGMIGGFGEVQNKALELSRQDNTTRVIQMRQQLQPKFDEAIKGIEEHYNFMQDALQSDRFDSNRQRLLDDASFTITQLKQKMGGAAPASKPATSGSSDLDL